MSIDLCLPAKVPGGPVLLLDRSFGLSRPMGKQHAKHLAEDQFLDKNGHSQRESHSAHYRYRREYQFHKILPNLYSRRIERAKCQSYVID